jgi:hypothetical protein
MDNKVLEQPDVCILKEGKDEGGSLLLNAVSYSIL